MHRFLVSIFVCVWLLIGWSIPARAENSDSSLVEAYLETLKHTPDDKEALHAIAFHYLNLGNCTEARKYGERLLALGEREKDREFCELYGHLIVGIADTESKQSTESYTHLETARTLAERTQNHHALVSIFNAFGSYALFVNNDIYSAISYYFQALEEAKSLNDQRRYAIILSNISGAYYTRNDLSGLKFAEEAMHIARECNETVPLYYGTMNAAQYYLMTDSLEQAARAIASVEQMQSANGFNDKSDIYLLKAMLHEQSGDIHGAYENYALAMENFKAAAASSVIMVYLKYAARLRTDHHIDSSIRVLEYGLTCAEAEASPVHKARLLKELSLSYREAGMYPKAMEYALRYQDYQDKLFNETRERALQETRIKHDIYSREQQINAQQLVILHNRYKITILAGILLVLAVALVMAYLSYKKKDRLYSAIVSQNREYMRREQTLREQLGKLRRSEAQPAAPSLPSDKQHDLMDRFTELMNEARLFTDASLTVATVADKLGTNRTYLSKAINESTGKTFTQVVNDYRIHQAIAEISDLAANKPLKQIAAEVGFSSLSTFYVTFQASTGMTPARYRSKLKEM